MTKPSGLSHDALWPRAGGWPAPSELPAGSRIDVSLVGVPASQTSLSSTNAHETPDAIRSALFRYSPALMQDRRLPEKGVRNNPDIVNLDELTVADFGNVSEPDSPAGEARTIAVMADAAKASELVIALGGDNSVTVAAALGAWGSDLSTAGLITLDAHYDLRDGVSNGSPVRRLIEAGLNPQRIVQIGIQDFVNSVAYARRAHELGITVIHRDELARRPLAEIMSEALAIAGAAGGPVHVDLDVDVCDRSVAPACPASVPGGISAYELRQVASIAAAHPQVRSLDLTEIDATTDTPDGRTVRLAALCVLEALAGVSQR